MISSPSEEASLLGFSDTQKLEWLTISALMHYPQETRQQLQDAGFSGEWVQADRRMFTLVLAYIRKHGGFDFSAFCIANNGKVAFEQAGGLPRAAEIRGALFECPRGISTGDWLNGLPQWIQGIRSAYVQRISKELLARLEHEPEALPLISERLVSLALDPRQQTQASDADATEDLIRPFPTHCLPGAARDMAKEVGRVTTSQNEPLAASCVIGILSASLGAGLVVPTGGERRTRPNLFILAIAESGTGKGEAYTLTAAPFETAENEAVERFEMLEKPALAADFMVAENRAKRLLKEASSETDPDARRGVSAEYRVAAQEQVEIQRRLDAAPCYKVADVTKEKLALVMQGQPGEATASLSSEARGLFSIVKGRYGKEGGDEDFYCSAYSGDSLKVDRVGRERVSLNKPCLSALWMVQPDAAMKAFGEDSFTESGLLPRFLMFDPCAQPQERSDSIDPIPEKVKNGWESLVRGLLAEYREAGDTPKVVSVTPEASSILGKYENENIRRRRDDGDLRDLASYVARWTENAWKIALVLHAATHARIAHLRPLDASTANHAIEISRWFCQRQLDLLAKGRGEKLRSRLLALLAILADAREGITMRMLGRSHAFKEEEVKHLNQAFPDAFLIEESKPSVGRPSIVVRLKK